MYGKAYESMYTGSMLGAGCNVFAVWNYVIAKTHRSVIELNPKLLAVILGGSEAEIVNAIEYLCRPDPESRSKEEEGRKMVREGQFQYRVVNWAAYQRIRDANDLREYNRIKQAEYRAEKKKRKGKGKNAGQPLTGETAALAALEAGDAETFERLSEPQHEPQRHEPEQPPG